MNNDIEPTLSRKKAKRLAKTNRQRVKKGIGHLPGFSIKSSEIMHKFKLQGGLCNLCGKAMGEGEISLDHIIPISMGGKHSWGNFQLMHRDCNQFKQCKSMACAKSQYEKVVKV